MVYPKVKDIEEYLGPYDLLLGRRIKETIDMFDEGLARWFRNPKSRTTLKGKQSYKTIAAALRAAKQDRKTFVRYHRDVPTKALAELFQVTPTQISQMKNGYGSRDRKSNEHRELQRM